VQFHGDAKTANAWSCRFSVALRRYLAAYERFKIALAQQRAAGCPRQRPRSQPQFPKAFVPRPNILKETQAPTASSDKGETERRYNLLTYLTFAQQCRIDFTDISWIDTQGTLGRGGQVVVSQTRASLDNVFTFKRRLPRPSPLSVSCGARRRPPTKRFAKPLQRFWRWDISRIHTHPNVVQLLAISREAASYPKIVWCRLSASVGSTLSESAGSV
jgi:hypothetical protein